MVTGSGQGGVGRAGESWKRGRGSSVGSVKYCVVNLNVGGGLAICDVSRPGHKWK